MQSGRLVPASNSSGSGSAFFILIFSSDFCLDLSVSSPDRVARPSGVLFFCFWSRQSRAPRSAVSRESPSLGAAHALPSWPTCWACVTRAFRYKSVCSLVWRWWTKRRQSTPGQSSARNWPAGRPGRHLNGRMLRGAGPLSRETRRSRSRKIIRAGLDDLSNRTAPSHASKPLSLPPPAMNKVILLLVALAAGAMGMSLRLCSGILSAGSLWKFLRFYDTP